MSKKIRKAIGISADVPSAIDVAKAEAQREVNLAAIGVLWQWEKKRRNEKKLAEAMRSLRQCLDKQTSVLTVQYFAESTARDVYLRRSIGTMKIGLLKERSKK